MSPPSTRLETASAAPPAELPELRLLVVDDHPAVRAGVRQFLQDQPGLQVIAAVGSAEAGIAVAETEPVDVAIIDYQLGTRSGLWLSRMLKRLDRAPRVLMYSAYCDGPLAAACVVAEADGLLSKGRVGSELGRAVRAVASGRSLLRPVRPALAAAMRRRLDTEDQAIFGMLLAGFGRSEVASTLGISHAELDARMWAMLRKLEGLGTDAGTAHSMGVSGPGPLRAARRRPDC